MKSNTQIEKWLFWPCPSPEQLGRAGSSPHLSNLGGLNSSASIQAQIQALEFVQSNIHTINELLELEGASPPKP